MCSLLLALERRKKQSARERERGCARALALARAVQSHALIVMYQP